LAGLVAQIVESTRPSRRILVRPPPFRFPVRLITILAFVAVAVASTIGQAPTAAWKVPLTPWGHPDLQGIWNPDGMITPPVERPKEYGTREFLTDEEVASSERGEAAEFAAREDEQSGPRSVEDIANAPGFEKKIYGQEYNNFWMARPDTIRKAWRRTSLVIEPPDGQIPPLTPQALQRLEAREQARRGRGEADSWEDRNTGERCITPASSLLTTVKQIVQAPDYVLIKLDALNVTVARMVPLDGRPHVHPSVRSWLGDPRGHWEGNTLVVDTTNFEGRQDGGPIMPSRRPYLRYLGSGDTMHLVERFTRVSDQQIEYRYTIEDPMVYLTPYTVLRPLTRDDRYLMTESACHEGNYGMRNLLSAGRANEKEALFVAEEEARERRAQLDVMKKRTAAALKK
jgi:hypothetical protein